MEADDGAELCFPHLLNTSCRKPASVWLGALILHTMWSFVAVMTVALNLLVIISISHFRQLHTPTNILLLSLAVSDFFVGLLLMPVEIFLNTACWFLGDVMCSVSKFISDTITSTSVGDMLLISVDRYVAICDPLHYTSRVTVRRVQLCVCLCWLCSVFYNALLVIDNVHQTDIQSSCDGECKFLYGRTAVTFDLVVTFILPITSIIVLYMRVFVVAVSQARAMRSHITAVTLQSSVTLTAKKSELKAARTLGVLVVVFLMCFCPFYGVALAGNNLLNTSSAAFALYLFTFNSCLNPIIYALFYPWFRKVIRHVVTLQILQPGSREANVL